VATIEALDVVDVRFPTSTDLDGSDAMNPDPDYSAAYATLRVDDGSCGHGFVFTIGRGNDIVANAVAALAPYVVGRDADELTGDLGLLSRTLIGDSQLRWLGPEKGVMHMAIGAVVNAVWDLAARRAGQPLWRFLGDLSPEQLVSLLDFRYLTDALTPGEALELLHAKREGIGQRTEQLLAGGYPAYTTSPGWLGYSDDKLARLTEEAVAAGYAQIKLKVGLSLTDDVRRMGIARSVAGDGVAIATDANQRWDVGAAIEWVRALEPFAPAWIEEPTSPDDILGHQAIRRASSVPVATGEHVQNRVIFKQLLQAEAVDVVQIDASRVGGVNENLAILLLAAKFGIPVCPHAGGVGLCELVQHLAMFDYLAVSGTLDGRTCEFVDHLHEHFADPARVSAGRYLAPSAPGFSARMLDDSIERYRFPDGAEWQARLGR
jgi:L-fuconate dehydratase